MNEKHIKGEIGPLDSVRALGENAVSGSARETPAIRYNPELVTELTDADTGTPVNVITVEKIINYTSTTEITPLRVKRLITGLCKQAFEGNDTIRKCLYPKPWDSFILNKDKAQQAVHGIRADRARDLYEYITNQDSGFTGFHQGASVGNEALRHLRQIVDNIEI